MCGAITTALVVDYYNNKAVEDFKLANRVLKIGLLDKKEKKIYIDEEFKKRLTSMLMFRKLLAA